LPPALVGLPPRLALGDNRRATRSALLTLAWPARRSDAELADFARGLGAGLSDYDIGLVGGDTVRTEGPMVASMTLVGACLGPGPVLRSGGRAGDDLWVTGTIGAGWLGLQDARAGRDTVHAGHYRQPNLPPAGVAGLVSALATASMDVSDGLVGDLEKLCAASGVGAVLDLDRVPLAAVPADPDAGLAMVTGGDDYQVLFAAAPGQRDNIAAQAAQLGMAATRIGALETGARLRLRRAGKAVPLPEIRGHTHKT